MNRKLFLIIAAMTVMACKEQPSSQEQAYDKQTITVAGTMTVPESVPVIDQMMVYQYNEDLNDYDEFKSPVDPDGNFTIEVNLSTPQQLALMGNSQLFFIAVPGDSLHISFKDAGVQGAEAEDVVFTGDRAATNMALLDYEKNKPIDEKQLQTIYETATATALTTYLDEKAPALTAYMDRLLKKHSNDVYLKEYILADKKYALLNMKFTFNAYGGSRGLQTNELIDLTTVLENLPELQPADFINAQQTNQYLYYTTSAMRTKTKEVLTESSTPEESQAAFLKTVASLKENALLKSKIVYRSTVYDFESNGFSFFENNQETIKQMVLPDAYKNLAERYEETKKLIENPTIPENASLLTFKTSDPAKYLDEIIANANGKVIYIDNWATWCGPCKQEFQNASPALHKKFKDQVEFVYLCHQSERNGYEPSIAKYKIAGKHYFLTQEESAPLFQQINLQGYPTYTIINKKGDIVSSDFTYRPSYPATTTVLTKLINE